MGAIPGRHVTIRKTNNPEWRLHSTIGQKGFPQLVDSGASRELVGGKYLTAHGLKSKKLAQPVSVEYMDGRLGHVTHATWQQVRVQGDNGIRRFTVKYLVIPGTEGFTLGMTWLEYADPDLSFKNKTLKWRGPILHCRKARTRIIQGEIQSNEPPAWVKTKHPEVLVPRTSGLPPHREGLDYEVKLKPGFVPKRQPTRRYSPEERSLFYTLGNEEELSGRWRIGKGPQAVQMLWAAKAGGKKRPCVDYRPLNEWIIDDAYPLPRIKDLMTDIAGCKVITSLDLPKAYNEIRNKDERTEDLLAFYCGSKLYAPRVMQFGSKTAVAHFQRFIMVVLGDLVGRGVHAFLDNIIVFARSQKEHDGLLDETLKRLHQNHLTIQPAKCEWSKQEVQFCGFLVGTEGIRLDPEKLRAIADWKAPSKDRPEPLKTQIREFLGFCNFYRDAVKMYSDIAAPLTALTSATVPWQWGKAEEASFRLLKMAILTAPVRAAFDETLPKEVHTDASDRGVGGTVEQVYPDGTKKPIAFFSGKLDKHQLNYATHDKELLAIVKTFRFAEEWLLGSPKPINVWTDNASLKWFLGKQNLNQRQVRWAEELAKFRFVIHHIPGRTNQAADALSRMHGAETERVQESPLRTEHFAPEG